MPTLRILIALLPTLLMLAGTSTGYASTRQDAVLINATQVLEELRKTPDQNVPNWLLDRAYAVAVVPHVLKLGFIFGGRRGSGALVVRQDNGQWSHPIFINLTGGSVGFQWGLQSTDVLLVFTSRASIEGITDGKLTLGADASVAAGPVGRQTAAATDLDLSAQVYSYSRNKGLFLGVSLEGSAITISKRANAAFYGKPAILASEITNITTAPSSETARAFIAALQRSATPAVTNTNTNAAPTQTNPPPPDPPSGLVTYPMEDLAPGSEPPE